LRNLVDGGRRNRVAFGEDRAASASRDRFAKPLRNFSRSRRRYDREHEVRVARDRVVVIDDLEAGAVHAINALHAAAFERGKHANARPPEAAADRRAHLACANNRDNVRSPLKFVHESAPNE
jgi:hypothetical protein